MQRDMFGANPQLLSLPDADIRLWDEWLSGEASQQLYDCFARELRWEQSVIQVYGKARPIPRLNAWYGDVGADYGYSGVRLARHDWHPQLLRIKHQVEELTAASFNSVLANWYPSGQHGVGWHSDDEPELGKNPVIASVSLGGPRRFSLRHRYRKELPVYSVNLTPGSLLMMAGATQHYWVHQLPKTTAQVQPRINLTYRYLPQV